MKDFSQHHKVSFNHGLKDATPDTCVAKGGLTGKWMSRERNRRLNVRELWDEIRGPDGRFRAPGAAP
jgi:hypothetical protein